MGMDIRFDAARYYDLSASFPNDIPFYLRRIPGPNARILELGCGTGRVTAALAPHCGFIAGVDLSEAMIAICREKLAQAAIPAQKAVVHVGDITRLDLGQRFDLIIAPFRVMQNLETDAEVDGLFATLRSHLAPSGTCILNVFNPNRDRETMRREWCSAEEHLDWQRPVPGGRLAGFSRRPRMDPEKMVLYPELIYRRYEGDELVDEAVLKILMRCYYPAEFEQLASAHGFQIVERWGGYSGEEYGQGPELVLQLR